MFKQQDGNGKYFTESAVIVDSNRKYEIKFVVCHISKSGNESSVEEDKDVLRANEGCTYHGDIVNLLDVEINHGIAQDHPKCLGGGELIIDRQNKTIIAFGISEVYGEPLWAVVANLLKEGYPGYNIHLKEWD